MADFNSLINENMENVKSYLDTLCVSYFYEDIEFPKKIISF